MQIDLKLKASDLKSAYNQVFDLAGQKVRAIDRSWDPAKGTPVFTREGTYTARGWTEWTQGFQYGCAILVFDGTGDRKMLKLGRDQTLQRMAPHVSHVGVHDHGFNNLSTYGNLRRLMREGQYIFDEWEMAFYEMAIKCSGAVQAARWSEAAPLDGTAMGYIYSFNGPHSLFIDTMRTIRILGVAHQLGHALMGENDRRINLLHRLVQHGITSAQYNIFYGSGRDSYDLPHLRGRTAHEAIFNRNDGRYRCVNSQQGYSPFSTWTRGLAWAMLGYAEELEFFNTLDADEFKSPREHGVGLPSKATTMKIFEQAARATCDFYINQAAARDGVCYWDTGAPSLYHLGDYRTKPADPFNHFEPVDSSASAIAAQGLIRLGNHLGSRAGGRYLQAGLTVARTLFAEPYLSTSSKHQGLLLHSVYHRPNGWDHVPAGQTIPCGESSMWGDYHLLELANLIKRIAEKGDYPTFFDAE